MFRDGLGDGLTRLFLRFFPTYSGISVFGLRFDVFLVSTRSCNKKRCFASCHLHSVLLLCLARRGTLVNFRSSCYSSREKRFDAHLARRVNGGKFFVVQNNSFVFLIGYWKKGGVPCHGPRPMATARTEEKTKKAVPR